VKQAIYLLKTIPKTNQYSAIRVKRLVQSNDGSI